MKKILIAVVALLVLGGGGAAAYLFFLKPAEASIGEEELADGADAHGQEAKDKHAKKGKGGHGEEGATAFFELDPLLLPILDNNGVNQTVSIVIALEVADAEALAEVERLQPKLKDAYIQDMYGMLGRHAALKGGVLQVGIIKKRLNKISGEVLGEGVVNDVLLQVVQQRPI